MPSGAKKRKAAKKKKELEEKEHRDHSNASSTAHSHGDDDSGHQDELDSPASKNQDDHRQHFKDGEDEIETKREDGSRDPTTDGERSHQGLEANGQEVKKMSSEEEGVAHIEREVTIEHVVPQKGSHKGSSSSSSSSSSSDDESHVSEQKSIVDALLALDAHKTVNLMEKEVYQENVDVMTETPDADVEIINVTGVDKASQLDQAIVMMNPSSDDNCMISDTIQPEKENGQNKLVVLEDLKDYGTEEREQKELVNGEDSSPAASDLKNCTQEMGYKVAISDKSSTSDTTMAAQDPKDSGFPHSFDNQPQLVSAMQPVHTTSWKSCCGLFELFSGSNT